MNNVNKPISETDVKNIQLMLSKNFKMSEIALIIGCSEHTVSRVKNGTHALLRSKNNEQTSKPNEDIATKLDTIIELLTELKSVWGE